MSSSFGTDGRQLALQLEELVGDNDIARQLIVRDYLAGPEPIGTAAMDNVLVALDRVTDADLLDLTTLRVFSVIRARSKPSTLR